MKLLDYRKSELLLRKYKIPLIETKIVKNEKEAKDFADKFGYSIILKVFSPEIFHRTEKKLIEFCSDEKELKRAFQKLVRKIPKKKGNFLLIQKKGGGIELICGMKRDLVFGPVLLFGLGGIFVEAMGNLTFAVGPVSKTEAMEMIRTNKIFKTLKARGILNSAGLKKLAEILFHLSRLAENNPKIKEIDFNPVFLKGKEIKAADFKFFIC